MQDNNTIAAPLLFHQYLSDHINRSAIKQNEMAVELGYANPNIISMIKQGKTRVPYHKIPIFAKLLDLDPKATLVRAMSEYDPVLLKTVESIFFSVISKNEMKIINKIRVLSDYSDPEIKTIRHKQAAEAFARELLS